MAHKSRTNTQIRKDYHLRKKLGPDFQNEIEKIIHQYLTDLHDSCTDSKAALADFLCIEERAIQHCWKNVKDYEALCTRERKKTNLTPFNWENETHDRVRKCFRSERGQAFTPQTVVQSLLKQEKRELREQNKKSGIIDGKKLAAETNPKPEYQGDNHPLAMPEYRVPRTQPRSDRAIAALAQFQNTGKASLPPPQAKIQYKKTLSAKDWAGYELRKRGIGKVPGNSHRQQAIPGNPMPKATETLFKAEPITALINEQAEKLRASGLFKLKEKS